VVYRPPKRLPNLPCPDNVEGAMDFNSPVECHAEVVKDCALGHEKKSGHSPPVPSKIY